VPDPSSCTKVAQSVDAWCTAHDRCHGAPCASASDCQDGQECNYKTYQCFDLAASCTGLDCFSNGDCPTKQVCRTDGTCADNY
jgi:hypothetical protein